MSEMGVPGLAYTGRSTLPHSINTNSRTLSADMWDAVYSMQPLGLALVTALHTPAESLHDRTHGQPA